ncbi:MAG: branched-chain amino acid ABC transporter substrate-binding protein [Vulcanimicrobiaceae bacterium]
MPVPSVADNKTIVLPIDLPFSGTSGPTMNGFAQAVELAVDQANAHGLPAGYRIVTERIDHGAAGLPFSIPKAEQTANALIADPRVVVVFGPYNSPVAKALIPVFNRAGTALVSSTATDPSLTKGATGEELRQANPDRIAFFRLCATNEYQGPAGAQFALAQKFDRVYVIDDSELFGTVVSELFEIAFQAAGGKIVAHDSIGVKDADFRDLLGRIGRVHPDAVYLGALGTQLGEFRAQMGKLGMAQIPLIAPSTAAEDGFLSSAGSYTSNTYYTFTYPDIEHMPTGNARKFIAAYRQRYRTEPTAWQLGSYASAQLIVSAITKALVDSRGAFPTRESVREAIAQTRALPTALGPIRFTINGDVRNQYISFYRYDSQSRPHFVDQANVAR